MSPLPPVTAGVHVVKLGGSLCQPDRLPAVLDWLEAQQRQQPLLVVCGGGRHADRVRSEQQRLGLDDLTAHRQALLGMEQTAWAVQALWLQRHQRRLAVDASGQPGTLWTPRALLPGHPDVAADWQMTSDSLAAWLAGQVRAGTLTLLKSVDQPALVADPAGRALQHWADAGWVDARFAGYAQPARMTVCLLGRQAWSGAAARVDSPAGSAAATQAACSSAATSAS